MHRWHGPVIVLHKLRSCFDVTEPAVHLSLHDVQVWAVPTSAMQCEWLGERVAAVDVNRAISNVINGTEDAGWGPNAVFRFPKHGGTGAIWKGVAKLLPRERQAGVALGQPKSMSCRAGVQLKWSLVIDSLYQQ